MCSEFQFKTDLEQHVFPLTALSKTLLKGYTQTVEPCISNSARKSPAVKL